MNKNKPIDSISAVFAFATHTRKLIAALALSLMWGCSSKTEEEPAQPAAQPQAVAPAPPAAVPEQPMAAEAPKQAMEAMRSEAPAAPAAETKAAEPAPAAPAPSVANAEGEEVFNGSCMMCHKTGVGGAPKIGDKTDWEPRLKQGMDVLYKHALEGFKGQKGMMPPRGGNTRLKDDQVKAAVDYMVSTAK